MSRTKVHVIETEYALADLLERSPTIPDEIDTVVKMILALARKLNLECLAHVDEYRHIIDFEFESKTDEVSEKMTGEYYE